MRSTLQRLALSTLCVALGTLALAAAAQAFTEPASAPPGGDVPAPINVSSTNQEKSGAITDDTFLQINSSWGTNDFTELNGNQLWNGSTGYPLYLNWSNNGGPVIVGGHSGFSNNFYVANGNVGIGNQNPASNSLTVDNGSHNMQFCLNGTDASHCTTALGGTSYWTLGGNILSNNQGGAVYVDSSLYAVNPTPEAGTGYARINAGTNTGAGYIDWFKPGGARLGYMGWDPNSINLYLQDASSFLVSNGDETVANGNVTANQFCFNGGGCITSVPSTSNWASVGNNIYNTNSANVGIGTTNPGQKLDVAGNINITNSSGFLQFYKDATPTKAARFGFNANVANGMELDSYNGASWTTQWAVDSSGNFGIGTNAPSDKLDVEGGNIIVGGSAQPYMQLTSSNGSGQLKFQVNNGASTFLGTTNNLPLQFYTNNTEQVRIDTSGNVGIGTNAPRGKLDVVSPGSGQVFLGNAYGALQLFPAYSDNWTYIESSNAAVNGNTNGIIMSGYQNTTLPAIRLNATSVGIGTNPPLSTVGLDVQTGGAYSAGGIRIGNYTLSSASSIGSYLFVGDQNGNTYGNTGLAATNLWANNDLYVGAAGGYASQIFCRVDGTHCPAVPANNDTLDIVTGRPNGNTTGNSITVGGLTSTGVINANSSGTALNAPNGSIASGATIQSTSGSNSALYAPNGGVTAQRFCFTNGTCYGGSGSLTNGNSQSIYGNMGGFVNSSCPAGYYVSGLAQQGNGSNLNGVTFYVICSAL